MKENKAVSFTKHELKYGERVYDIYINKIQGDRRPYTFSKDVSCQYDVKRIVTCTCQSSTKGRQYFSGIPKQIYAYHGTRSVTDVGVGSVKALQRRRVRRIYLPETDDRGIGSEDLSAFVTRRIKPIPRSGYYDQKKTSSKCIGGIIEYNTRCVLNEKLSPIIQTKSGATSPSDWRINIEVASNTIGKDMVTNTTQVEIYNNDQDHVKDTDNPEAINGKLAAENSQEPTCSKDRESVAIKDIQVKSKRTNQVDRIVSSDSFVQHVHNLENPSDYRQSRTSVDLIENKLEREYRKIFSTKGKDNKSKGKPTPDMKSASILRRRFEALRRGAVTKEDSKKNDIIVKESSQAGVPIRKDVSITSDPPSLEGRSYSNTKTYSPFHFNNEPEKSICKPNTSRKKSSTENKEKDSLQWPQMGNEDSDCQGVKGMFKLWGKSFDLEEDTYKKRSTPISSRQRINTFMKQPDKKAELKLEKTIKKDGRKFFFFKKRSKEKSKPYKSKKGLTAGRCEVGDGLTIKIDGNTFNTEESKKKNQISDEILRKQWLYKYLTHAIESKNSVQIRWNNKTYATSSSTIFELMDNVYQDTGILFRSRSEVTTGESSFYRSRTQHVNFAHQEIEAWMIPKTIVDSPKQKRIKLKDIITKDNTNVRSAQKWFIDKAKAFSRKIEVVLHTKHVVRTPKDSSSEYLRIDIPKGFFVDANSSDENRKPSSDEEVFKIVEYETESESKRINNDMVIGDHLAKDVKFSVQEKSQHFEPNILGSILKLPAARRDVVIQGSDVNIPKRCDVIGVGIITQTDLRDIRKPILKIQDYLTDEDSDPNIEQNPKKCAFAESYLHDYYRHWIPLGIDLFSWCVSDSQLRCNSENSEGSYYNQGDGSKSCPNIYDDFQTATLVSSNHGCVPCHPEQIMADYEEIKSPDIEIFKCKWLRRLKVKKSTINDCAKRILPKDSFEVFKRRKIYASSDKSKWTSSSFCDVKPYSVPSIEDKEAQGLTTDISKTTMASRGIETRQRPCMKHVSMREDGTYEYVTKSAGSPAGILMFRGASGCDVCKEAVGMCPKHATVDPVSCEIPDPPCRPVCLDKPDPPCSPVKQLPKKKQGSPPNQSELLKPFLPESVEPIIPPYLTTENLDEGPPCEKCRSFKEENSPEVSSQEKTSPTKDTKPATNTTRSTITNTPTKQACILCPHFPPCRKSQSCQKSVDLSRNLPEQHPQMLSIDSEAKNPPVCTGPPCISEKTERKKGSVEASPSLKSNNPSFNKPSTSKGSEQFPWPLKSQKSDQSMQDLTNIPPDSKSPNTKLYKCKKDCPFSSTYSTQTIAPKKVKSEVKCKVESGTIINMKSSKTLLLSNPVTPSIPVTPPIPITPSIPAITPNPVTSYERPTPRITSIKQKQSPLLLSADLPLNKTTHTSKPSIKSQQSNKKTCSEKCSAIKNCEDKGIIQLSSKERITIRMKEPTPSTEEIREAMNIKVKDDDGNTLYERIDYKKSCKQCRPSLLGDKYKSSEVNRCPTPIIIKNFQTSHERETVEEVDNKSDSSVANLVEIQFKLKLIQGDKTTELNIGKHKHDNNLAHIKKSEISSTPQDVFIVKDNDENLCAKPSPKNDVNIRIVIKNFKSKPDKTKSSKYDDDFSQNISHKFHTVSTGYSDAYTGQKLDNVFSVHRATVDLTTSNEKLKTQVEPNEPKSKFEFTEEISKITTPSNDVKLNTSANKPDSDNFGERSFTLCKNLNYENEEAFQNNIFDKEIRASLYTEPSDQDNVDLTTSNADSDMFIEKPRNKEQKKELLKKVMEKAHNTKNNNKDRMTQLRDMLKVILTSDSSGHNEMAVNNELLKDVTFASLRPSFFNETDSMTTSNNNGSMLSLGEESESKYYPTQEQNSECSASVEETCGNDTGQGCMCNTFAERLNMCGLREGRCCCRGKQMRSEVTSCDIKTENDILFMNIKTAETVNVETQPSKNLSSRAASVSYSIRSGTNTKTLKNKSAVPTHFEQTTTKYELRENTKMHTPNFFLSRNDKNKETNMKNVNRNITLNLSDEERAILLKATPTNVSTDVNKMNNVKPRTRSAQNSHILQSYAVKKAVLEIYAEKTIEEDGEHMVAKLPKFVYNKESEIRRYQKKLCNFNSVCKKNVVMISVER